MKTSEIEMKQTYLNDGYCLKRHLIPLDMVFAARERVHEMMEDQPDWAARSWQVVDPARKQNSKGQPFPVGIQRGLGNHPELLDPSHVHELGDQKYRSECR